LLAVVELEAIQGKVVLLEVVREVIVHQVLDQVH
jgi:hypothetical protein